MPSKNLFTMKRQKELIMINRVLAVLVVVVTFACGYLLALRQDWFVNSSPAPVVETIPDESSVGLPIGSGADTPLSKILKNARYTRVFSNTTFSKEHLFTILFAAQGKITNWGERTVPSYKSQFPITLEVLIRNVEGITPGFYWFNPSTQTLEPGRKIAITTFTDATPGLKDAPVVIIANTSTARANDVNAWSEAGGIAQNILLAASESTLATFYVPASSISQADTAALALPGSTVLWLMPLSNYTEETINTLRNK